MSWQWRMKPRSIIKTIQWFPYFAALKGQNWGAASGEVSRFDGKPVHPVRRAYIYRAHGDEDGKLSEIPYEEYLCGRRDFNETEGNGRNDKTTFEFYGFGYVDKKGIIHVTEMGDKIVQGTFDSEDYLRQLLKMHLPNPTAARCNTGRGNGVFPFQVVLRAFEEYESLNRSELALLFGCARVNDIPLAISAVGKFKTGYAALPNKNDTAAVKELYRQVYTQCYGKLQNKIASYYDYAEALSRTLVYTGLFTLSGRSIVSKLRVAAHSAAKVAMLQEKYQFVFPDYFKDKDDYMGWYGSAHNVTLPWENAVERRNLIQLKAQMLLSKLQESDESYESQAPMSIAAVREILQSAKESDSDSRLKQYESRLGEAIAQHNEAYFKAVLSKKDKEREAILNRFEDILDNDDMSALWLEVNTWKSLLAVDGTQTVKRNFKIEEDLTPRSFAPGVGNTPDMEVYHGDFILVPEVSLMTGVRQWEHEASSVIDHVLRFIKEYGDKTVMGIFLSSKINQRTMWQFFILNRESWVGAAVPVVPFTIRQYMKIIQWVYSRNKTIDDLIGIVQEMSKAAFRCRDYHEWEAAVSETVNELTEKNCFITAS